MVLIGRFCFAALLIVAVAYGSRSQAADSVVGSWRLASCAEVETESKVVHTPFGENPSGVITYTPDGRMSVLVIDPKRKSPAGPKATDAEGVELYQTMIAYPGVYSLDGNKVTHKIEVSWNQAWTGTNQQRFFEVKDDMLTIKTPQIISPITGKESVSTLVWERVK
jgi:Lipocalin-like domain